MLLNHNQIGGDCWSIIPSNDLNMIPLHLSKNPFDKIMFKISDHTLVSDHSITISDHSMTISDRWTSGTQSLSLKTPRTEVTPKNLSAIVEDQAKYRSNSLSELKRFSDSRRITRIKVWCFQASAIQWSSSLKFKYQRSSEAFQRDKCCSLISKQKDSVKHVLCILKCWSPYLLKIKEVFQPIPCL